mmetsp:Transcript_37422/g.117953  ORF Transcript_37422/g.117953 Transcript_37422/m.117953 type:complete len:200 (-) Transcript_37422:22-621(-)
MTRADQRKVRGGRRVAQDEGAIESVAASPAAIALTSSPPPPADVTTTEAPGSVLGGAWTVASTCPIPVPRASPATSTNAQVDVSFPSTGAGSVTTKPVSTPPSTAVSVNVTPSRSVTAAPSRKNDQSLVSPVAFVLVTVPVTTTRAPGLTLPPLGRGLTLTVGPPPGCTTSAVCMSICRAPLIALSEITYGFPPGSPRS